MEKNTTCISNEEFLDLANFRKEIEANNTIELVPGAVSYGYGGAMIIQPKLVFYSKDKTLTRFQEINASLEKQIKSLVEDSKTLRNPQKPEITISDIKKMSVFEFLRWKKK